LERAAEAGGVAGKLYLSFLDLLSVWGEQRRRRFREEEPSGEVS